MSSVIGYYAHHHGRGHLQRATSIARVLPLPVHLLSSCSDTGDLPSTRLPLDTDAGPGRDPTVGGTLHWAPLGSAGLTDRMTMIARWIDRARPAAIVVDVSAEVALLARLCGVPTVVVAMPGERSDAAHQLALRSATAIIAAWPRECYEPEWLRPFSAKTSYVGGISQHDGREPAPSTPGTVLVLGSGGGITGTPAQLSRAAAQTPRWRWRAVGAAGAHWCADPWPLLTSAEVVVSAAGQNSVADIACAGRAAVVIPQQRPYAEQQVTAGVLADAGLVETASSWPDEGWAELLAAAADRNPQRWRRWQTRGAAARAAEVIAGVAR